ncbi:MAG: gliding motility-associated C-terminal domain-containing protein [Saprospiraceae bacterium]|nr:gliding motility-associated C-terminal domain-containing protein [Saprospiraceae bacterium]
MARHNSPSWITGIVLLLGVLGSHVLYGQCDPPALLPTVNCGDAPQICLNEACYSTQNIPDVGHSEFCGPSTLVHNPQYILFTATSTNVSITITVTGCSSGTSLQAAIIHLLTPDCNAWQNSDVIVCDPGFSGSTTLQASVFEVDTQYLLLIDGSNAATCEYVIGPVMGTFEPQLNDSLTNALGEPQACQGQDSWTASAQPSIADAAGYIWSGFPWGNGIVTSTLSDLDIEIPNDATPGIWEICVRAFTGCDTTNVLDAPCFEFEIYEIDDAEPDSITLCPEELMAGYSWHSQVITSAGTYTEAFDNALGCPYDSILVVESFPASGVGQIDTVVCATSFDYESVTYSTAGSYELLYDDASLWGCDSTAMLNLDLAYAEAEITMECDLGEFVLTANVTNVVPSGANLNYLWTDDMGTTVGDQQMVQVPFEGTYNLEVSIDINGTVCSFMAAPINIVLDDLVPPAPTLLEADSMVCELDFPDYTILDEYDIIDIVWEVPPGAAIFGQGSNEVSIDWQGSSGGQVCVYLVNDCGDGPPTCFNVQVLPAPDAMFDVESVVCADSSVIVNFTGSATVDAEFQWDFDGATILSGGTGPGPHEIAWSTTGNKEISLSIIEEGCDTASVMQVVIVESLGVPVVNCSSTVNSITFQWGPVSGADGYMVNVLSGATGGTMQGDSAFLVSGLNPGDTVVVEVVATSSGGACAASVVMVECVAEDCTPPGSSNIMAPDSICLGDVTGTISLSGMVDGMPASGTWSGPGIVDAQNGTFDPADSTAGVGIHQVVFTFDFGGCMFNTSTQIRVFDNPTADFVADSVICESETATVTYTGTASGSAMYTWDFGGGQIMSGSGAGPYEIMWNQDGPKTVSLTVEENGCVSTSVMNVVDLRPTLTPPSIQCMTTTGSITFSWSNVPNAVNYQVNLLNGASGTESPNQYAVTGLMPGDSSSIELVVSGDGTCPPVRDTMTCYAQACPSPTITVSPMDTSICLYAGTPVLDLEVTVQNGSGSGSWSGPGIVDANQGLFDPMAATAGPGTHVITYNYTDQGCAFSRQVTIRLYDPPQAVISNTDLVLSCDNNNELTLDGTQSTGGAGINYLWTTSNGVLLSDPTLNQVTAGAPGTYTLLLTNTTSGCVDSTSVTLQQDADVPTADAGPDVRLDCNLTSATVGGSSSTGSNIVYEWSTGEMTPTITVTASGVYEIIVRDTSNGCFSRDEAVVTVDTVAPVPSASVGGILDCDTDAVDVTSSVSGGSGDYSYAWSSVNGVIQGSTTGPAITATSPGMYQVVVTDNQNGCLDSISVEVMADDDVITNVDVDQQFITCAGDDNASIAILSVIGGSPPYSFNWSTGSTDMQITGLGPGNYTVNIVDANGCTFQRSFDVPAPVQVTADIGGNLRVNQGDSVVITLSTSVTPGALGSITWSGPFPPCDMCTSVSFDADQSGTVMVTVVDTNGCSATASLLLEVLVPRGMYVPNVFTPNGDGVNDYFTIFGTSLAGINSMRIFDRWGEQVFERLTFVPNVPEAGWDGTLNGETLTPGVYVFRAEVVHQDGLEETVTGDITLLR